MTAPDVKLLPGFNLKRKVLMIDGQRVGEVEKVWFKSNGLQPGFMAWTGEFDFGGQKVHLGPTDTVAEIVPKVLRRCEVVLARKAAV